MMWMGFSIINHSAIEVSPFMETPWIIFDDLSLNSTRILGGALKKEHQAPKALHQTYLF